MVIKLSCAVAALALFAAPAFAGDAACFWNAAPEDIQAAFLAKAEVGLPEEADFVTFAQAVSSDAILKQCGVTAATGRAAAAALDGLLIEVAAVRRMEALKVATGNQLSAAWAGMDPAMRQSFLDRAVDHGAEDPQAIADFLKHAGLTEIDANSPAGPPLVAYITGRAQRVSSEAKF
ncbi:MAG TPA: hypothetical protein VGL66_12450 [Caulobacteraceae bacterium]